jgi:hypothetical protein
MGDRIARMQLEASETPVGAASDSFQGQSGQSGFSAESTPDF